ncbi:MAG: hypothetical protein CMO44_10175 [Verrucomicrobiales bacterium]|nr:hypothetical protein [Verrucomicrobiales bacterium]
MVRYFIGSILSPYEKESVAENDPTFGFTKAQADSLDVVGKPIRMEHNKDMVVGKIVKQFASDDGSLWVMGKLDGSGYQERFAQYAVDKNPDTGGAYYQGLSLQHVHRQLASGKSEKTAVEVSLVCEPRRSDCRIAYVDSDNIPDSDQIKNMEYILKGGINKMETATANPPTEVKEVAQENVESVEQKTDIAGNMTKEQMMKIIIEQQKSLEVSKTTQNSELEELRQLKQEIERQKAEELKKEQEKSHAMAQSLVNDWSQQLDKDSMSDAQKTQILETAQKHPHELIELLRVAHCASKKAKEAEARFNEYKSLVEKTQLSQQFDQVMSKKKAPAPVVQQPQVPVVHAASNKKRKTMSNPELFLRAMSSFAPSGSARDHMEQVSKIGVRKKYTRESYY